MSRTYIRESDDDLPESMLQLVKQRGEKLYDGYDADSDPIRTFQRCDDTFEAEKGSTEDCCLHQNNKEPYGDETDPNCGRVPASSELRPWGKMAVYIVGFPCLFTSVWMRRHLRTTSTCERNTAELGQSLILRPYTIYIFDYLSSARHSKKDMVVRE